MLVVLRLCQGLSASGEQAGANAMTLEHAPAGRRAFFTSFTLSGTQAGFILATAVFLPISSLPEDQLLSWGWRVPFWLSLLVVGIGYWIRRTLDETPAFNEEAEHHRVARMPLAILFRDNLPDILRVVLCALVSSVSTIFGVYSLSYAGNTVHIDRSTMLWVAIATNVVALAFRLERNQFERPGADRLAVEPRHPGPDHRSRDHLGVGIGQRDRQVGEWRR